MSHWSSTGSNHNVVIPMISSDELMCDQNMKKKGHIRGHDIEGVPCLGSEDNDFSVQKFEWANHCDVDDHED